jgi:hypothetical protein
VIRLSPEDSARWHAQDVKVWAPARRDLRRLVAREASLRWAQVELQDADGTPLYGRLPPLYADGPDVRV